MCIGQPNTPAAAPPPGAPPAPLEVKEQLKPLMIGKDRKKDTETNIGGLRRDLTRPTLGGPVGGNLL